MLLLSSSPSTLCTSWLVANAIQLQQQQEDTTPQPTPTQLDMHQHAQKPIRLQEAAAQLAASQQHFCSRIRHKQPQPPTITWLLTLQHTTLLLLPPLLQRSHSPGCKHQTPSTVPQPPSDLAGWRSNLFHLCIHFKNRYVILKGWLVSREELEDQPLTASHVVEEWSKHQ